MQGLIQGFSLLIGFDLLRYPFFDGLDPIFTAWFRMDSGGVWGGDSALYGLDFVGCRMMLLSFLIISPNYITTQCVHAGSFLY